MPLRAAHYVSGKACRRPPRGTMTGMMSTGMVVGARSINEVVSPPSLGPMSMTDAVIVGGGMQNVVIPLAPT